MQPAAVVITANADAQRGSDRERRDRQMAKNSLCKFMRT